MGGGAGRGVRGAPSHASSHLIFTARPGPWHQGQMVKLETLGLWEGRATPASYPAVLTPQGTHGQPQTLDGFLEREGEGSSLTVLKPNSSLSGGRAFSLTQE